MNDRPSALLKEGQSIWQDDIARTMFATGSLRQMIEKVGIRGVTSNPTIFEKAIGSSDAYDDQIAALAAEGLSSVEIFEALAVQDIQDACDLFLTVYEESAGQDGYVSMEVPPNLARDAAGTRDAVRRIWDQIARPNLMVKIPGTLEGTPVIEEMLAEGKNINVTLLFSLEAYERVANAYLNALEQRVNTGKSVSMIASVASFFVSRVDTAVDSLLAAKIDKAASDAEREQLTALQGQAAVANAKLAYASFQRLFSGTAWERLTEAAAKPQRPLWASTGTKNPAYSDVLYVDNLIGPHTVNTMPAKTIDAFLDHGVVARTVDEGVDEAAKTMQSLAAAGINFDAVTTLLEAEGIASFMKSYQTLLQVVEEKRLALVLTN